MMLSKYLEQKLSDSSLANRLRKLNIPLTDMIDFSHNDYLGFSRHPLCQKRSSEFAKEYGTGATASRLISGNKKAHQILENKINVWKQCESTLLYSSGYAANLGLLSCFLGEKDLILGDKLNHASIVDGGTLSKATYRTFKHRDYSDLRKILETKRAKFENILIVSDSVFSMDGALADIQELVAIKKEFECWLMLDEAHATGVFGLEGQGLAFDKGLHKQVDISVGTLSKSLASQGGFVSGSNELIQYLINYSRSFIYSTGLSPSACGAADAAIDLLMNDPRHLQNLWSNQSFFCEQISKPNPSPIFSFVLEEETKALQASDELLKQGFFVKAIRPPTVPPKTSRLRITIGSNHQKKDLSNLSEALKKFIVFKSTKDS